MKHFLINISLQIKITLLFLLFILLPLLVVSLLSYKKSSETLTTKISESNLSTLIQVGTNVDLTFSDINSVSLYLPFNKEVKEFYDQKKSERKANPTVYHPLSTLFFKKSYFKSVYLETFNGYILDSIGATNTIDAQHYQMADAMRGGHLWFKSTITVTKSPVEVFSLLRVFKDINTMNSLGYLKINIGTEFALEMMDQASVGSESSCVLVDSDGVILLKAGNNFSEEKNDILQNLLTNSEVQNFSSGYFDRYRGREDYLVSWYKLKETEWVLINIIPRKDLLKDNNSIKQYIFIVMLFCFIILAPLAAWFISRTLKPIKKMSSLMKNIHDEDFDVFIEVEGNNEIATLGRRFNKMSARLKTLVEQEYLSRIKLQSAELQALQEQINPHFLYNTLDTICWMCRLNKDFEAAELVEALSSMFRLSLNSGNDITTVSKEVEHLKNYYTIQSKRYTDVIDFHLHVDEKLSHYQTSKITLQPLVENAIQHGIEPTGKNGRIDVSILEEDGCLIFEVKDNGLGFNLSLMNSFITAPLKEDNNRGFAIKNVHERIRLLYGEPYGLQFFNNMEQGAVVRVKQPLISYKGGSSV